MCAHMREDASRQRAKASHNILVPVVLMVAVALTGMYLQDISLVFTRALHSARVRLYRAIGGRRTHMCASCCPKARVTAVWHRVSVASASRQRRLFWSQCPLHSMECRGLPPLRSCVWLSVCSAITWLLLPLAAAIGRD